MKRSIRVLVATAFVICGLVGDASALDVGKPMPEIGLKTLGGKKVTVAALKGKVVIVDFWATWCGPCKEEMPVLQKLYAKYGKQGLVVVGVSVDRESSKLKKYLSNLGVTFPVVHDGEHAVTERYEPAKMPSSFIIGRDGKVKFVHPGFSAKDAVIFEKEVKALLKK